MPEFKSGAARIELDRIEKGISCMTRKQRLVVIGNGMAGARFVE
jgi:hypothetical protein